jgi:hypothetical protein
MAVNGRFSFTMTTPMGEQKGNISFIPEGESIKGIFKSILGTNEYAGGKVDGDDFSFSFKASTQMGVQSFDVKGTVEDDSISGVIKTALGAFFFKGKRDE